MPFIFLFQRVSSLALFIFITGELGWLRLAQRDAKLFKGIFFRASLPSPEVAPLALIHATALPHVSLFTFFFFSFFFSQLATWFHVLIFHVSFLAPISTGFSSRRGVNDFFFPSSSKMEGIKTRHFNAPSWPTFAKWWFREKCRALRKKKGEDFG